jgi:hypothetical protein
MWSAVLMLLHGRVSEEEARSTLLPAQPHFPLDGDLPG